MANASSGSAKGTSSSKGASTSKGGIMGGYTGFRDMFDGGGPGKSGAVAAGTAAKGGAPATSQRPQARPGIVSVGQGSDQKFMDTRTGQSYAAPSYGQFSFKGLTSSDPANVARNQFGRERLDAMMANRRESAGGDQGLAALQKAALERAAANAAAETAATPTAPAAPTPAQLAAIGAPTTPMGDVVVAPPVYGIPPVGPAASYGSAFAGAPGAPQFSALDLIDLFGAYPNFGMR